MVHNLTKEFEWEFKEYIHREKDRRWLAGFGLIIIIGTVIAFLINNTLLASIILIGGALLLYVSFQKPKDILIEISRRGIKYGDELFPYEKIEAFWVTDPDKNDSSHLLVMTNREIFPLMSIPLPEGIDLINLRDFLDNFIPEIEMKEPAIYKLVDHFGI